MISVEPYPYGKRFSVTLVDDTDKARLEEIRPVYNYLHTHGIRTTKTVWPLKATALSGGYSCVDREGETLQCTEYRVFCKELQSRGFELAMHTATAGDSKREETLNAYDFFEEVFGHPPFTNVMHARNREISIGARTRFRIPYFPASSHW